MTHEEKQLMDQYGITCEEKMVFYFQGHKCEQLNDAVNYAKKMAVYRPEANYVFCRLPSHSPAGPEVAKTLFIDHNI